jgi:tRNA(adenine34) deaminase
VCVYRVQEKRRIRLEAEGNILLKRQLNFAKPIFLRGFMEETVRDDEYYMREAIALANKAKELDEVPVGALCVRNGEIISSAYNTRESSKCATHHAEILAIEGACRALGGWRLPGVTLYVTMEPCVMCAGAIINSRIERVVFGAKDFRFGAFGSLLNVAEQPLNHKPEVVGGILGDECAAILSNYFLEKRSKKNE